MLGKLWKILSKEDKQGLFLVALITFIGNIMEMIGVTMVIPFINAVMIPENFASNKYFKSIFLWFHLDTNVKRVLFMAISIIVLYWIKDAYTVFMYSIQYRYICKNREGLSNRLFGIYVKQPYLYHVKHNSAELIRNVSVDVDMFGTAVLQLIHLQTSVGICLLLLIVLLYKDKSITFVVMFCMIIFIVVYNTGLKKKTQKCGIQNRETAKDLQQHMIQAFQGIKEIKVTGREEFYLKEYSMYYKKMIQSVYSIRVLGVLPKPIMEAICITGLMGVIAIKVFRGVDLDYFIPTLALFAMAAFKMFPSIAVITASINSLIANKSAIDVIYERLQKIQSVVEIDEDESIEFMDNIELRNVTFSYPDTKKMILKNVNIKIYKNQSVAFIGPSGGGKTTLADIVLGLLSPNQGNVLVDGIDIKGHIRCWENMVGYIPQSIYLSDTTIRKNIAFGIESEDIDDKKVLEAIKSAQLESLIEELEDGIETVIGEGGVRLSGGQRQRIGIARALYNNPEVLILDEATSALDGDTESAIMDTINNLKGKRTLLIIAHRLSTIKGCDSIYCVSNGNVELTSLE